MNCLKIFSFIGSASVLDTCCVIFSFLSVCVFWYEDKYKNGPVVPQGSFLCQGRFSVYGCSALIVHFIQITLMIMSSSSFPDKVCYNFIMGNAPEFWMYILIHIIIGSIILGILFIGVMIFLCNMLCEWTKNKYIGRQNYNNVPSNGLELDG